MYYLWLTPNTPEDEDDTDPVITSSHYFNITGSSDSQDPASSSTQVSAASSDPTGSTTAGPASTGVTGETAGGLSTGAKAGIGVGASLGGLAVITLSFLLLRRARIKHKYQTPSQIETQATLTGLENATSLKASFPPSITQISPAELPIGNNHWKPPLELPTSRE